MGWAKAEVEANAEEEQAADAMVRAFKSKVSCTGPVHNKVKAAALVHPRGHATVEWSDSKDDRFRHLRWSIWIVGVTEKEAGNITKAAGMP